MPFVDMKVVKLGEAIQDCPPELPYEVVSDDWLGLELGCECKQKRGAFMVTQSYKPRNDYVNRKPSDKFGYRYYDR